MNKYRVSADIGGTFTDLVFYDILTGDYRQDKVLSTPNNLCDAIMEAINKKIDDYSQIEFFVHGTTYGLNVFLERKGSRVALITTKGFRDVYMIGRGNREEMYNLFYKKPKKLVERKDIFEVEERILSDGTIKTKLTKESVLNIINRIKNTEYDSIAVCLINSYVNPIHEIEIEKIFKENIPDLSISPSYKIAREWREYERTSSTVLNAYISSNVQKYLKYLEERMKDKNYNKTMYIMQSGGGVITTSIAKENTLQTLLSGPVGGAIGAKTLSEILNYKNLIAVDMGGTSYDVNMVMDGKLDITRETNLQGFPILVPMVNIYSVGAGGGSIAWIEGGGLRVGPQSAGANPGPACYGKGGKEPTITDANLVLGRIEPDGFLGGNMNLDKKSAIEAVKTIAEKLNLSVIEAAEGICKIADAKMADAIRQITIRKGVDPRKFILVAFGGAGPMHVCLTSEHLGIETILVPDMPGIFSAWGMLQSDIRYDVARTIKSSISSINSSMVKRMNEIYKEMKKEVLNKLLQQNIDEKQCECQTIADARYVGQEYTIRVPFRPGIINSDSLKEFVQTFNIYHHNIYGYNNSNNKVEIVNLCLVGIGKLDKIPNRKAKKQSISNAKPRKITKVVFYSKEYETKIFERINLKPGQTVIGPAIIEELTSTTVVPPGYKVTVDEYYNLLIKKVK